MMATARKVHCKPRGDSYTYCGRFIRDVQECVEERVSYRGYRGSAHYDTPKPVTCKSCLMVMA